jgi:FKBP-type peptidyl-prolyl cis-trans isomerase 2
MTTPSLNPIIRVDYELRIKGGEVIESSKDRGPLEFIPGQRRLLPALEKLIAQLAVGDERSGDLPAKEAFGNEELLPTKAIPLREFPENDAPTVGRVYEARSATDEKPLQFKVVAISDKEVTVRFLHPLGDRDLSYRVRVLAIDSRMPPPPPADAVGIDSTAIQLDNE